MSVQSRIPVNSKRLRGFTLVELAVASTLVGVLAITFLPMMAWVNKARQQNLERQIALEEVNNILESVTIRDWNALTSEQLGELQVSDQCRGALRNAELRIDVVVEPESPASKRVTATLTWETAAGVKTAPMRMTAWAYEQSEAP